MGETLSERFGLNTLLGRHIVTTSILVLVTVIFAWGIHSKLSRTAKVNAENLQSRASIRYELGELNDKFWKLETDFQSYMLVPNQDLKTLILDDLENIQRHLARISANEWLSNDEGISLETRQIQDELRQLTTDIKEVIAIRADPMQVFPAIAIMVSTMNPASDEFYNQVTLAIQEAEDNLRNSTQRKMYKLFSSIRTNWLQKLNTFRLFAASRMGVFSISVEQTMQAQMHDMETYDRQIVADLNTLRGMDRKGKLEFQQSSSLAAMLRLRTEWNRAFQEVSRIYSTDKSWLSWRRDTPILYDRIFPRFTNIWSGLRRLNSYVESFAVNDIAMTTGVADQASRSLWLVAIVITIAGMVSLVLFWYQVRNPLIRISRAFRSVAGGEPDVLLPETSIRETQALIDAFADMRRQVFIRHAHLQSVLTYAAEAIITTDLHGNIESFNPAAEKLFGYQQDEILGRNIDMLMPDKHRHRHSDYLQNYHQTGNTHVMESMRELTGLHKDDFEVPVLLQVTEMYVDGKRKFLAMISDDRERRTMVHDIRAREQRLHSIVNNTAEGIITFDGQGMIETWNQAAEMLFGCSEQEATGESITKFISSEFLDIRANNIDHFLQHGLDKLIGEEGEILGCNCEGTVFPVSVRVSKMELDSEVKYTALVANIAERKAMMDNLRFLAEHDGLTGLYNRAYFQEELERVVDRVRRDEKYACALLYIDLDNFKYVNDTLGHNAGDKILVDVTHMLSRRTRRSDLLARLGGDEFVVLLAENNRAIVSEIADSFRLQLADYVLHYEGKMIDIGCSIGIAMITTETESVSEVMSQADVACHLAKRAGKNRVHVYSPNDDGDVQSMSRDMGWTHRIKQALETNRFVLAIQPIVKTHASTLVAYEVLLRMYDDDDSLIMPSAFMSTAERFGLATDIDTWVIKNAIKYLAEIRNRFPEVHFSINLSAQSLTVPAIPELITGLLQKYDLDASALTFEVTETMAIADMDTAVSFLSGLQKLGCRTSLDDFGSGMSSFAYLRELPVDMVKIDGRFVKNLTHSQVDQAVVRAMNDIAHALDKETVAEFVENETYLQLLGMIGIDYVQGYHLGKPELLHKVFTHLETPEVANQSVQNSVNYQKPARRTGTDS